MNLTHCCKVTELDLISQPSLAVNLGDDQLMLYLLQGKGAPVKGFIIFEMKKGFDWRMEQDPRTNDFIFQWGIAA